MENKTILSSPQETSESIKIKVYEITKTPMTINLANGTTLVVTKKKRILPSTNQLAKVKTPTSIDLPNGSTPIVTKKKITLSMTNQPAKFGCSRRKECPCSQCKVFGPNNEEHEETKTCAKDKQVIDLTKRQPKDAIDLTLPRLWKQCLAVTQEVLSDGTVVIMF